jgi:predicted Fe-Mo cluster-binding NifX family protein
MRIAVTAQTDQGLDAPVAQHFGHAQYFVLLDVDAAEVTSVESILNPFAEAHQPGQVPQFISEQRAEVMLSGGMGARAIEFFNQCGVTPASGASGTVAEAVGAYLDGRLSGASGCADSEAHSHS